jgi:Leucine-rich repeat (LRR) protein
VKKLLKFCLLLVCVFIASNLFLKANGETYYQILEVNQDATQEEIKDARNRIALKWHPDKNPEIREEATEKMKEINEAYEILSDLEKKTEYDRTLRQAHQRPIISPQIPSQQSSPNSIIIPLENKIDCQILTQSGFAEVKIYLQRNPVITSLRLKLTDNTRQIPEDFFIGLNNISSLDLSDNELTKLPSSIGQLEKLNTLWLSENQLTSLPESIGDLESLSMLFLMRNQLTSLPEAIGNLINLEILALENNQLTELPPVIGQLSSLRAVNLMSNHIIPWPRIRIFFMKIKNRGLEIFGGFQIPAPQQDKETQPVSFFKKLGSKIKFSFSKIFKRRA